MYHKADTGLITRPLHKNTEKHDDTECDNERQLVDNRFIDQFAASIRLARISEGRMFCLVFSQGRVQQNNGDAAFCSQHIKHKQKTQGDWHRTFSSCSGQRGMKKYFGAK